MRIVDKDTIEVHVNSQRGFDNGEKIRVPIDLIVETSCVDVSSNDKYRKLRYFLTIKQGKDMSFHDLKISKKEYEDISDFILYPSYPARPVYNAIYELGVSNED